MIWVIRLYLLIMAFVYAAIGVWALLDPLLGKGTETIYLNA